MDAPEEQIEDVEAIEALRQRATRIHWFSLLAGAAFAGWSYLAWQG